MSKHLGKAQRDVPVIMSNQQDSYLSFSNQLEKANVKKREQSRIPKKNILQLMQDLESQDKYPLVETKKQRQTNLYHLRPPMKQTYCVKYKKLKAPVDLSPTTSKTLVKPYKCVDSYQKQILQSIGKNKIKVIGYLGAGKSTRIPQILYKKLQDQQGIIVVTKKSQHGTILLYQKVISQIDPKSKCSVSYQTKHQNNFNQKTKLLFIQTSVFINNMNGITISYLIIDDIQSRDIETQLLIYLTEQKKIKRIFIQNRLQEKQNFQHDQIVIKDKTILAEVCYQQTNIFQILNKLILSQFNHSILVFCQSAEEIDKLRRRIKKHNTEHTIVILKEFSNIQQVRKALQPVNRIILATHHYQQLYFPQISVVIDSGVTVQQYYDHKHTLYEYKKTQISLRQAKLRLSQIKGQGKCYRLYQEQSMLYFSIERITDANYKRLDQCILWLLATGVRDILQSKFIGNPEKIKSILNYLISIKAVDQNYRILPYGECLLEINQQPFIANFIAKVCKYAKIKSQLKFLLSWVNVLKKRQKCQYLEYSQVMAGGDIEIQARIDDLQQKQLQKQFQRLESIINKRQGNIQRQTLHLIQNQNLVQTLQRCLLQSFSDTICKFNGSNYIFKDQVAYCQTIYSFRSWYPNQVIGFIPTKTSRGLQFLYFQQINSKQRSFSIGINKYKRKQNNLISYLVVKLNQILFIKISNEMVLQKENIEMKLAVIHSSQTQHSIIRQVLQNNIQSCIVKRQKQTTIIQYQNYKSLQQILRKIINSNNRVEREQILDMIPTITEEEVIHIKQVLQQCPIANVCERIKFKFQMKYFVGKRAQKFVAISLTSCSKKKIQKDYQIFQQNLDKFTEQSQKILQRIRNSKQKTILQFDLYNQQIDEYEIELLLNKILEQAKDKNLNLALQNGYQVYLRRDKIKFQQTTQSNQLIKHLRKHKVQAKIIRLYHNYGKVEAQVQLFQGFQRNSILKLKNTKYKAEKLHVNQICSQTVNVQKQIYMHCNKNIHVLIKNYNKQIKLNKYLNEISIEIASTQRRKIQLIVNELNKIINGQQIDIGLNNQQCQLLQYLQQINKYKYLNTNKRFLLKFDINGKLKVYDDQKIQATQLKEIIFKQKTNFQVFVPMTQDICFFFAQSKKKIAKQICIKNEQILLTGSYQQFQQIYLQMKQVWEECEICLQRRLPVKLSCGHKFCSACLLQLVKPALQDRPILQIRCPHCNSGLLLQELGQLISQQDLQKVCHFMASNYIEKERQKFAYCPNFDCQQVVQLVGRITECMFCQRKFCKDCKQQHSVQESCKQIQNKLPEGIKRCPKCSSPIEKSEGCNHITCTQCQVHFCWVCLQQHTQQTIYRHQEVHQGIDATH